MSDLIFGRQRGRPLILAAALVFLALPAASAGEFTEVDLDADSRWDVEYLGRDYDAAADQTAFAYLVTVSGDPALSHFALGLPICDELDVVGASPEGAQLGLDPTTGVYGLKWDLGLQPGDERIYIVVVDGEVAEGVIVVAVKAGTFVALGSRLGPSCDDGGGGGGGGEVFDLSGTVFLDADRDGAYDGVEPVFPNVAVFLCDEEGNAIAVTFSDASGFYEFLDLPPGVYFVKVPELTEVEDFNEILYAYFDPTTVVVREVHIVDADSDGHDFGYVPDGGDIIDDLDPEDPDGDGFTFSGTGHTIGFWKHQLRVALKGRGRAQVDVNDLAGYLPWIESFYLADPFLFPNGFMDAYDVLASRSSDGTDLLLKQLLGTEFNAAAGWGLDEPYQALQDVLMAWGEYLAANDGLFSREELLEAKDVFDGINNTGE
jgi:hypothetical protein